AVYTATLTGPHPPTAAVALLERTHIRAGPAATALLDDHATCYPPTQPQTVLEPLYPDRLREDFIALQTPRHHLDMDPPGHRVTGKPRVIYAADPWAGDAAEVLLTPDDGTPLRYTTRAVTVLTAAAHRWAHLRTQHLTPLLHEHPRLAVEAGGAAL